MGFLDGILKKEKVPKTSRSTRPPPANVNRSSRPQTGEPTSIFGSLRRLKSGVSTSTPKKPPDLEVKKKLASSSGVSVRVDNNANVTSVGGFEEDSGHRRRRGKENIEEGGGGVVGRRPVPGRTTVLGSKNRTKGSAVSLQQLIRPRSHQSINKPKRPISVSVPGHVTVRRGHKEGQGNTDNLSRTSSITNLDSLESSLGKGAKPRKAASKERIDKQSHDGKKVTKNNNKLEPPTQQPLTYSSDSLQHSEAELQQLRKQLRDMADEKSSLALQLGEQRGQLNVLQNEILKLKCFQEESNLEMEKLAEENTVLRNRLRDVAHSPLSDNEKQQLLFDNRHHNSAPASIATNAIDDTGGDATTCTTPDWDKQSSGNVSEVSVACLQDKINQMQETHYSTNEELQATLQELTDLQRQLTELQQENERLNEEKTLMFDSLCRQTERLKESRQEVEKLNQLIYSNRSDETGINQFENAVEREQQLVEVLRTAQDEREQLLLKLDQIQGELQDSRKAHAEKCEALAQLTERLKTLECTLDAKNAEHKQLDQELTQTKDQYSGKQIEVDRLSDLLETARTKIIELEQDRALSDKSELDEMLDNARKEKDQLESEVTYLKEQLARSKNEIEKLKEQVFMLQEECKVTRNNAKTTQADLEYKCEKVVAEKNNLNEQLQQYQEVVNELQLQSQCHLEDKRQLSAVLSETQRNMSETERKNINLENELLELKKLREEENDEWEKFQNDLLTSVRVANDFKTEAQQELQKIILENKTYREKVRLLEGQLEKLKASQEPVPIRPNSFPTEEINLRRKNAILSRQSSRQSVRSLIDSIESQGKPIKSLSRSSSASSLNSLASDIRNPSSPSILPTPSPGSPLRTPSDWSEISTNNVSQKTPLKEQQPNKIGNWGKNSINDTLKQDIRPKSEDTYIQKSIDFSRRNSYSDLSERKDPLNTLVKNGGSKRNALLKWCQNKTVGYRNIDITNFSSSWNDGLALCALLHTYLPDKIPYDSLTPQEKRRNFSLAFSAAESVGIVTTLNINDMIQLERPDWQQVMSYVTAIYKHFEA
ncbi:cytospin-A-like isoform X4 [Anthonomus grandis grandis]|uniref:cytospin-A-like isoform X4 n=1 Tax=Anthonomus grandis grandis TaxID=2921223 RepID=UPI0021658BAA|nr:cytospin-A-like isoform X4 [Anthonomus grandis grandis]